MSKYTTCAVENCGRDVNARELCAKHYARLIRGYSFEEVLSDQTRRRAGVCTFQGCGKRVFGHGLCSGHYTQKARGKDLVELTPYAAPVKHKVCSFNGCEAPQSASGYCTPHYHQRRDGRAMKPLEDFIVPATHRDSAGNKRCHDCREYKPESEYGKNKRASDGLSYRCFLCARAQCKAASSSGAKRASKYGLTVEDVDKMHKSQNGKCATCQEDLGTKYTIDHDHECCPGAKSCGRCVRGLLCHSCNLAFGLVKDRQETLSRMIGYLQNNPKDPRR